MLSEYVAEVQDLLNDEGAQLHRIPTLKRYINRSRRRIASISGCIRHCPEGARTHPGQEQYPFAHWQSLCQDQVPGTDQILFCRTLSVSIGFGPGAWTPMWRFIPFMDFQARVRVYNRTFLGTISEPGWWTMFGSGPKTVIYLAPIPMQEAPIIADLSLLPMSMKDDDDPEPIPFPWTDVVVFWAATMALLQQQRKEDAAALTTLFSQLMPECASVVAPFMFQSPYAGGIKRSA